MSYEELAASQDNEDREFDAAMRTRLVLAGVGLERRRQDARFGEQNHPDGTSADFETHREFYREFCDQASALGTLTFKDIFLEEVYEALSETDSDKLEAELIQVAAVVVNWIEKLRRERA